MTVLTLSSESTDAYITSSRRIISLLHSHHCKLIIYTVIFPLPLHFNGHFPDGPGLTGTGMSPFWILLELRLTEVMMTTGAIRCAKLQSNHHHQQTNSQLFTDRMPFLSPNQQCQSTEGKKLLLLLLLLLVCKLITDRLDESVRLDTVLGITAARMGGGESSELSSFVIPPVLFHCSHSNL